MPIRVDVHALPPPQRSEMPAKVNPLADRLAELIEAEVKGVDREILRRVFLTLAFRASGGTLAVPPRR
jgi:hypothetical protein